MKQNKVTSFRDEWIDIKSFVEKMNQTEDHSKLSGSIVSWGDTAFEFRELHGLWTIGFAGRPVAIQIESLTRAIEMVGNQEWDIVRCVSAVMGEYMYNELRKAEIKKDADNFIEDIVGDAKNNKIKKIK